MSLLYNNVEAHAIHLAKLPNCVNSFGWPGVILLHRAYLFCAFKKEIEMKSFIAIVASVFAMSAFAQAPVKKEEKKVEAKPAASAPAPATAQAPAAKSDAKKAEPAKK